MIANFVRAEDLKNWQNNESDYENLRGYFEKRYWVKIEEEVYLM